MLTTLSLPLAFELMMVSTSVLALLVSGWLIWRSWGQRDLLALAGFSLMMAFWSAGHAAILLGAPTLGVALVLANPLMPTCFLDFALRFVNQGATRHPWLERASAHIGGLYVLSLLVVALSWWQHGGEVKPVADFARFFVFTDSGWFNLGYTVLIGILAHWVLMLGFHRQQGNRRRSIVAIFVTGGWGLALATSFVMPSLGWNTYPYPMLLLPSYVVLLVYSVLRYQLLSVNAWANRALLWVAMNLVVLGLIALAGALAGRLGMEALAMLPGWQLWLYSLVVLSAAALLRPVLSALAERLVYPGLRLNAGRLEFWRAALRSAEDWPSLAKRASELLSPSLGQPIQVSIYPNSSHQSSGHQGSGHQSAGVVHYPAHVRAGAPTLECRQRYGQWECEQKDWHDLTPAMRVAGEVYSSLLASSCALLEQSRQRAEAEAERLAEQHLVELGGLSAAMAHELRNPLNIISMAATSTDTDTRTMIAQQITRADRLISDMLSYSGQLRLQPQTLGFADVIRGIAGQIHWQGVPHELVLCEQCTIYADPYRVQQVLTNLVDNALAFVRNQADGRLLIEADEAGCLRVHNNGPALPESLKDTLFRPFVSKRPGGSGLGLAIVRRIMEAHGGSIVLLEDRGWPVTFEARFPCGAPSIPAAGEPSL